MKIIHIITSLGNGGAESSLFNLIKNTKSIEHVVICLTETGFYTQRLFDIKIETHCINMQRGKLTVNSIRKINAIIRSHKNTTAIQAWMYHSNLIASILGFFTKIPVFWSIHNTVLEDGKTPKHTIITSKLCAHISKTPYLRPRKIISCAYSAKEHHISEGYKKKLFEVIPNGYDTEKFKYNEQKKSIIRNELNIENDAILFGNIARYDPYKDHANLFQAFSLLKQKVKNIHLVCAGAGMEQSNKDITEKIKCLNINDSVTLLGSRDDIDAVFSALDFNILSSQAEAFPNVLGEAMSCQVPCITTNVGDAKIIIAQHGWIVPTRSPEKLAAALHEAIRLKEHKIKYSILQKNCREHIIKNFSIQETSKKYQELWREVETK